MSRIAVVREYLTEKWISYRALPYGNLLVPLIIAVPTTVLGIGRLHSAFPNVPWLNELHGWLSTHTAFFTVACFWPLLLIPFRKIGDYFDRRVRKRRELNAESLLALLGVLDEIVGSKEKDHIDHIERILKHGLKEERFQAFLSAFCQPTKRIKTLTEKCYVFFGWLLRDASVELRVFLAEMGPEHVENVRFYFPENRGPQRPLAMLQGPSSTLTLCKKRRKMLIVSDIEEELRKPKAERRYMGSGDPAYPDCGSLVCFPVHGKVRADIPYVICIHTATPGIFSEAKYEQESLRRIMDRFEVRMKYEYTRLRLLGELMDRE